MRCTARHRENVSFFYSTTATFDSVDSFFRFACKKEPFINSREAIAAIIGDIVLFLHFK